MPAGAVADDGELEVVAGVVQFQRGPGVATFGFNSQLRLGRLIRARQGDGDTDQGTGQQAQRDGSHGSPPVNHLVSASFTVFLPALIVHSRPDVLISAYFAGSAFGPNFPSAVNSGLRNTTVMPYLPAGNPSKA